MNHKRNISIKNKNGDLNEQIRIKASAIFKSSSEGENVFIKWFQAEKDILNLRSSKKK